MHCLLGAPVSAGHPDVAPGDAVDPAVAAAGDVLYQVSTIDALLAGVYDAAADVALVLEHGDFGLGTFEALDGEMIVLDGLVYQAAADGAVNLMPPETGTPFATVTPFSADVHLDAPGGLDYAGFKAWLTLRLPSANLFYAVRVEGRFGRITYRSIRPERRPYRPLAEVAKEQQVFSSDDIGGTLVGFWCPSFSKGINVPGFHLHFLSDDRQQAGHLLDFDAVSLRVQLDITDRWDVDLPMQPAYLEADLTGDRDAALRAVEQGEED
jgi:acetolactate decarboxylase